MSDCIIRIKIGDDWIELDPNSNIAPNNKEFLVNSLDINRLRTLYSRIRSGMDFAKDVDIDPSKASEGASIYQGIVETAAGKGDFVSPIAALKNAPPEQREQLAAYLSTLDGTQILTHGNYLLDPSEAYKLSPYTHKDIQNLVFAQSNRHRSIFSLLTNLPGMDTLRISLAYANDVNGVTFTRPTGRYMRPDNIIQVLIPDGYYSHGENDRGVVKTNLTKDAVEIIRDTIIHELSHAVLSEAYIADSAFRAKVDKLHEQLLVRLDDLINPDGVALKEFYKPKNATRENELITRFKGMRDLYSQAEVGPHEFLSNLLEDKSLWDVTNLMVSKGSAWQSPEDKNLYDTLLDSLPTKYKNSDADTALKDAIAVITSAIPDGTIKDTFEKRMLDYVDPSDKRNLFYMPAGVTEEGQRAHIAPRDQVDSYWTKNEQAYRFQRNYLERSTPVKGDKEAGIEGKPSMKNAYYKSPIEKPTKEQKDQLYAEDLVLIPWSRWNSLGDDRGQHVRVGVVLDKKGVAKVDKNKKLMLVDVTRDENGKVVQNSELGTIEERFNHVPVLHSNMNSKTVTVAKVGLSDNREDWKYNSLTIPYDFIDSIRKFDYSHFDHTHDYDKDLEEAKADLVESKKGKNGLNAKIDWVANAEKGISDALANKQRAVEVTEALANLHAKYAYTSVENDGQSDHFHKNVTEEDYLASGWDQKNLGSTTFADADNAVFRIKKTAKGHILEPNRKMYQILWQSESGTAFAKASQYVADAVVAEDLVRINKPEKIDGVEVPRYEWLPVYKKLANGVLVGTKNGKGYIVSFNNIDSYAKNTTTRAWQELVDKQKNHVDAFTTSFEEERTERKSGRKPTEQGVVTYKSLQSPGDEKEEDVVTKFIPKSIEYAKSIIQPGISFVRVDRKFMVGSGDSRESIKRPSNELVVAKTDEGVVTMRFSKEGDMFLDHIRYTDKVTDAENYGKELLFLMEDLGSARKMWAETEAQQELFNENSSDDKPAWEDLGNGKYKPNFNFKENPRNIRDRYAVYESINGVAIARMAPGDMVGIPIENGTIPRYFRKVLRVLADGRMAVVENRKEWVKWKSGMIGKSGPYIRYLDASKIDRIAYRMDSIEGNKDDGFTTKFHQDILDRRVKMFEYANADKDWDDFDYAKGKDRGANFNKTQTAKPGAHFEYVPLTNALKDPDEEHEEEFYLDRAGDRTDDVKEAAMVKAWIDGKSIKVIRGIKANTEFVKAELLFTKSGEKTVLKDIVKKVIKTGDWLVTPYTKDGKKKMGRNMVDRVEGNNVYTVRYDMDSKVQPLDKVVGIAFSTRNSAYTSNDGKWKAYKRVAELKKFLSKDDTTKKSLDLPFKSPKDSRRALYEVGNRLQDLNPDIALNYIEGADVAALSKQTGHDYSNARAFVMNGEVFVNLDKASVSDVVHEYAHLFLHAVRYDNPELYQALIKGAKVHPLYDNIAAEYSHLNDQDTREEVFVTLLGEYMKGSMGMGDKIVMDANKQTILEFSQYTKEKLEQLLGGGRSKLQDTDVAGILNMRLEDVIGLVGDHIMSNRISSVYDDPKFSFGRDVSELSKALKQRGFLTEECYG